MLASRYRLRHLLCSSLAFAGVQTMANEGAASASAAPLPRITVIELPSPLSGVPNNGRQRTHHALSFATDAPKPLLRSLGLDAIDCSLRLRLPSRLTPSRDNAVGMRVDVQAQAGLACRF